MKNVKAPKFIDSPYFVPEQDNWHLLPGAPESVQQEFDEFIEKQREAEEEGVFV
jgi:hypothetical protein